MKKLICLLLALTSFGLFANDNVPGQNAESDCATIVTGTTVVKGGSGEDTLGSGAEESSTATAKGVAK